MDVSALIMDLTLSPHLVLVLSLLCKLGSGDSQMRIHLTGPQPNFPHEQPPAKDVSFSSVGKVNHDYSFYDYDIEKEVVILDCYTCHYSRMKSHDQGMPNCDDPFSEEGIPTVKCEGLCAKTRTVIGDGEYMLIRSCLPNCREIVEHYSSVYCCYGERCNGAAADAARSPPSTVFIVTCLLIALVFVACVIL